MHSLKIKYKIFTCLAFVVFTTFAQTKKPNIIFIFSDDQSFETIGANRQEKVITPNLDRLTKEGTTFTHAYNMGSWAGAVCRASRSMLNTGHFLWNAKSAVEQSDVSQVKLWPQMMSEQGYKTYLAGKWHVPISEKNVFDIIKNVRAGMPRSNKRVYDRPKEGENPATAWYPWGTKNAGYWQGGTHWSKVLGDDGVAFIEQAANEKDPFFMYLAFNAPHDPRQAPKEYVDMYPLDKMELPKNYRASYPDMNKKAVPKIRDENLAPFPRTEYAVKVHRQEYFASITYMDAQIGRILKALDASGKADNTWIIYTSDHGLAVGRHGLMGKQNMYEHSMRAPFIINGPGVKGGKRVSSPIYLQDAMATSLEIAGAKNTSDIDFKSVLPLLKKPKKKNYDAIYGAYMGTQRMVVVGDWKLIAYPKLRKYKLFNLKKDPLEMQNLATDTKYAKDLERLKKALENQMDELKDPMTSIAAADYTVVKNKKKKKH